MDDAAPRLSNISLAGFGGGYSVGHDSRSCGAGLRMLVGGNVIKLRAHGKSLAVRPAWLRAWHWVFDESNSVSRGISGPRSGLLVETIEFRMVSRHSCSRASFSLHFGAVHPVVVTSKGAIYF